MVHHNSLIDRSVLNPWVRQWKEISPDARVHIANHPPRCERPGAAVSTRWQVRVDPNLCEAHALCIDIAPGVFDLGDEIATCDRNPDESNWDSVQAAVAACPRQAISVVEE